MSDLKKPSVGERIKNKKEIITTSEIEQVAKFIDDFNPQDDKFKRTLIYQGYVAARRALTGNHSYIAKSLGIGYNEYKYYLDTKPEFAAAIRQGIIDGKEEFKNTLVTNLMNKAQGMIVTDKKTEDKINMDTGEVYAKKITTIERSVEPDTQAILRLLEQLDPSWKQKSQLDVNVNDNSVINVTENKLVKVDLRMLSPEALRELLASEKQAENKEIMYDEDGVSVNNKDRRRGRRKSDDIVIEKPKRVLSEETKEKMRLAKQKRREAKEQMKKETDEKLKKLEGEDNE